MLRSLYSGVAGLKTHQTKMDVIGNNISNVNTYGFKGSRVTFRDVYYQTLKGTSNASGAMGGSNASQIGYGATVGSIDLNMSRSGFASTGLGSDCYIDGEGYFVIQDGAGNERLTRVGTFSLDGQGNLVDGNKNFVCGYPVDSITSKAAVGGASIDFGLANGSLFDGYAMKVVYADPAAAESTAIAADDASKTLTVTYTPSDTEPDKVLTMTTLQDALTTAANWTWAGGTAPADFDPAGITVTGSAPDTEVIDTTGMAEATANFDYGKAPQKIINSENLINIAIGADGTVTGQTDDGRIQSIGQIALANVPNPQALVLEGSSYFKAVNNTGAITYGAPGSAGLGGLETGGLEMSNVDLSTEFSDMIMTQRGFQANSRIITVSDEMLEELVNLKR